ncbi:hypothetical protein [Sphingosinicella sp.]|uniref:hypothetical protein n=1 Tax=Sphingosinicella sp. TaxID=1917971 RepID=UPI0040378DF5
MTRIDQVDQALLLLREQLQRMGKSHSRQAPGARARERTTPSPMARFASLASLDDLPEDQFRRTLVRALLAEDLGDAIANDPAFQSVIDDVFRIINESDDGQELMAEASQQIRSGDRTN